MKKKIFVITGEASGDLLAYDVLKNLDLSKVEIKGIVGNELKKLDINGPFENKEITFFGITDVLKNFFFIKKKIDDTVGYIENYSPDIVFSVDSPDFVFQVIKKLKLKKNNKSKFFHYVAPSIWAWRESRGYKIKKLLDKIYLLFEFEKKYFDKYLIKNFFVGHPFFENFNFENSVYNSESRIISLCPGSRKSELEIFVPIFINIIKTLGDKYCYHFAVTENNVDYIKNKLIDLKSFNILIKSNEIEKFEYFKKSLISIAKSGTISLDLCKAQIPFFTIYKFSWLNYFLIKPFVKVKFANIINIIANREVVPEFIQWNCTSKKIIDKIYDFIENKNKLKKMINEYNVILKKFANQNTSKKIANDLMENL